VQPQRLLTRTTIVLLVDDDEEVRQTLAEMLEELGYTVIQATCGSEALSLLDMTPELDILVTDVRMPGMSGLDLSLQVAARRQSLPIILMSGFFRPQAISHRFLQKPFRTDDLDAAIRAELSRSAPR